MSERLQKIVLLLSSWLDDLPGPTTWPQNPLCQRTESGFVPRRLASCQTCAGRGRRGKTICTTCAGRGRVALDPYDKLSKPVGAERTVSVRCMSPEELDRAIQRSMPYELRDPDALFDGLYRTLKRHAARCGHPTYRALERAMKSLGEADPAGHFLCCWVYVLGIQNSSRLLPVMRSRLLRALVFLAAEMPQEIVLPRVLEQNWSLRVAQLEASKGSGAARSQSDRNLYLHRLRRENPRYWTQRRLGLQFNLTQGRISQILRRVA